MHAERDSVARILTICFMLIPATLYMCFDFEKLKFSKRCPIAPIPRSYGLLVLIFVFYGKNWSREKFFGCDR